LTKTTAGYLTVVPDLPGLTSDEITPTTLSATIDVALAVSDRPDARGGKVGLVGGSTGATLAILAAEDPRLAGRVRAVSGIAPYADIKTVLSIATTGHYELDGEIVPYQAEPFLSYVVARSVISALPPGEDREKLLREIRQVPRDSPDPLASLRARRTGDLGPEARSVVDLLGNRDSGRFVRLYRQLPEETRRSPERLSPVAGAGRLLTPVEVVTGPRDRYFPASESYELERVAPRRVVTVTGVLAHYMPRVSARTLPEFVELNNYAVRSLRNMRAPDGGAGG
jgi:pimeloyl-ACP methyl ester carboxylesterase